MLARRRGLLMTSLAGLMIPDLLTEIAHLQWEMVIETANAVYHWPDAKKRQGEIDKLARSRSEIDRYAHALIVTWQRLDRERSAA
jgi:hypothetical protein